MKVVSFNVNGLRPRAREFGGLKKLLDALDADIICLQETKLVRTDISDDIAFADGYESFFAFPRGKYHRSGWSGVATFCRTGGVTSSTSPTLPKAAEEGFTGVLHLREGGALAEGCIGHFEKVWAAEVGSRSQLEELDQEGRVVVTDHGAFVLFNIYGPCVQAGDTDRIRFKLAFYHTLQRRWESLLEAGRRLVVVGDLNISPAQIDSCDPSPDFDISPSRQWLHSMLRSKGGPFTDSFRSTFPERREAYTCFSTASGAAAFNYGTRIDLILVAGPCQHASPDSVLKGPGQETRPELCNQEPKDTAHLPSAEGPCEEALLESTSNGGACREADKDVDGDGSFAQKPSQQLRLDEGTPTSNGSVHLTGALQAHLFEEFRDALRRQVPVWDEVALPGAQVQTPTSSSSGEFEADISSQQRPELPAGAGAAEDVTCSAPEEGAPSCSGCSDAHGFADCEILDADILSCFPGSSDHRPVYVRLRKQHDVAMHKVPPLSTRYMPELRGKQTRIRGYFGNAAKEVVTLAEAAQPPSQDADGDPSTSLVPLTKETADILGVRKEAPSTREALTATTSGTVKDIDTSRKRKGNDSGRAAKQKSLKELFGVVVEGGRLKAESVGDATAEHMSSQPVFIQVKESAFGTSASLQNVVEDTSSGDVSKGLWLSSRTGKDCSQAAADWARLRQRMAAHHPFCRHNEPAVARVVKKPGPTVGRTFYCCARATGPSSNPEARCDYFEWATSNTTARSKAASARSR